MASNNTNSRFLRDITKDTGVRLNSFRANDRPRREDEGRDLGPVLTRRAPNKPFKLTIPKGAPSTLNSAPPPANNGWNVVQGPRGKKNGAAAPAKVVAPRDHNDDDDDDDDEILPRSQHARPAKLATPSGSRFSALSGLTGKYAHDEQEDMDIGVSLDAEQDNWKKRPRSPVPELDDPNDSDFEPLGARKAKAPRKKKSRRSPSPARQQPAASLVDETRSSRPRRSGRGMNTAPLPPFHQATPSPPPQPRTRPKSRTFTDPIKSPAPFPSSSPQGPHLHRYDDDGDDDDIDYIPDVDARDDEDEIVADDLVDDEDLILDQFIDEAEASSSAKRGRRNGKSAFDKQFRTTPVHKLLSQLNLGEKASQPWNHQPNNENRARFERRLIIVLQTLVEKSQEYYKRQSTTPGGTKAAYKRAMDALGNKHTGPISRAMAVLFLTPNFDTVNFVRQALMPRYPGAVTDILGRKDLTAEDLLDLPQYTHDDLLSSLVYMWVLRSRETRKVQGSYTGSAIGEYGGIARMYTYHRARANNQLKMLHDSRRQQKYLQELAKPGVEAHVRAIAVHFPKDMPIMPLLNEACMIIIMATLEDGVHYHQFHTEASAEWYADCRQALEEAGLTVNLGVQGLNRALPIRQGVRSGGKRDKSKDKCCNCGIKRPVGTPASKQWVWKTQGVDLRCGLCYGHFSKHGTERPKNLWGRVHHGTTREHKAMLPPKPADGVCKTTGCDNTYDLRYSMMQKDWVCGACFHWEKRKGTPASTRCLKGPPPADGTPCPTPSCNKLMGKDIFLWCKVTKQWLCKTCQARQANKEKRR